MTEFYIQEDKLKSLYHRVVYTPTSDEYTNIQIIKSHITKLNKDDDNYLSIIF